MSAIIELKGVHKTLGNKRVLAGLNLTVNQGETLVIIGRSGSGKSVTLKHIVGLLQPDAGNVIIEGRDTADMSYAELSELRMGFGFLFQDGALLNSLTVGENVALPLREHTRMTDDEIQRMVAEKLAFVGLELHENVMPSVLSGGMKKRVGLARAIIREPQIMLYDEPTHGLDPIMSSVVNELINNMKSKSKVTSIVVTHDMPSAFRVADRIAMLYGGVIIKTGTPQEFLEADDPIVKQFVYGEEQGPITT
ncbi:MAG: ABC transporter ATP-binding protein [Planctomycetota bacterium]|nr:ABC transporter ATP-binding protein [Planctomycetota bacterium]